MNISSFFNSTFGMYITQSFCHALIAAIIVDASLDAWKIEGPLIRQRFRVIVILLPIISFPLYQVINPERGSFSFRVDAFFDTSRWLNLEIWGYLSGGLLFCFLLIFTALVFLFQEVIPIVRHMLASRDIEAIGDRPGKDSPIGEALALLPDPKPDVFVIDEEEFQLFSTTGKHPAIFLSNGFARALTVDGLQAAIAHEIGHIARSRRPLLVALFLLRMVLFFNLIALMEFRRIVQEEEKICDDFAVSLTGRRDSLAETLRKFYYTDEDRNSVPPNNDSPFRDRIEEYGDGMLIESRISRLEEGSDATTGGEHYVFVLTLVVIVFINYFVV